MKTINDVDYYNTTETAEQLGIQASTLRQWRKKDKGPKFVRWGRDCLYEAGEIKAWLNRNFGGAA